MKNCSKKIDTYILFMEIVVLIFLILPILIVSFFSIPIGDDFSTGYEVLKKMEEGKNIWNAAMACTVHRYLVWGGFYSGQFLNFLINPYINWGMAGYHIVIFLINLFSMVSLYFFVYSILKYIFDVHRVSIHMTFYLMSILMFYEVAYNSEIYYWYCVSVSYTLLISLMLWAIGLALKIINKTSIFGMVMAGILGFIVSGAALNVVALNCGIALLIFIYGYVAKKKWAQGVYFCGAFLGAITNVCAPGNFIRHESIMEGYAITDALMAAFKQFNDRILYLMKTTPYIMILSIVFIISIKCLRSSTVKGNFKIVILMFLLIYIAGTVVNFPVLLGYGEGYFPDRCVYVEDCLIYIGFFVWTIYLAKTVTEKRTEKVIGIILAILTVINGSLFITEKLYNNLSEWTSIKCIEELHSGTAQNYYDYWSDVLNQIEQSNETVVTVIKSENEGTNHLLPTMGITSDEDNWVNKAVAIYYGKETIQLIIE